MDICYVLRGILNEQKEEICKNMTKDEKKTYDYTVKIVVGTLRELLECQENPVVHIRGLHCIGEFGTEEMLDRYQKSFMLEGENQ